jgi:hypothetical protein
MGQSYVQVASQDLDQAPPAAQARVDSQPVFDENDMMAESARREKRKMKQMENSGQVEGNATCVCDNKATDMPFFFFFFL